MKVVYTDEQRRVAVATYRRLGSYAKTLRKLGYPSRHVLHDWVRGTKPGPKPRVSPRPPRRYSWEFKAAAVQRVLAGEDVRSVGLELRMATHVVLYKWVQIWREHGERGLMSKREKAEADGFPTRASIERSLPDDLAELKRLAAGLMVEKAVLEQELELVKKDEGVIPAQLSNRSKTQIVEALRPRFPLALLLEYLGLRPSSYHYARAALCAPDKHAQLRGQITSIAKESLHTYGSPRVWLSLRRAGVRVSEKVVRRLMKEERIPVFYAHRKRTYSSYAGETSPAPKDLVQRKFQAPAPNQLWLTDVTEFAAPDAKVYLSPMIDCFDGKIVAWRTSRSPNNALTQRMLEDALATLSPRPPGASDGARGLRVHTDRGSHYRGMEWIETLSVAGAKRSMSRKGNSGDNAACEGFFGRMKTEMFYGRRWQNASQIENAIAAYIDFYNNVRIKVSLGGISIREHRELLKPKSSKKLSEAPFGL